MVLIIKREERRNEKKFIEEKNKILKKLEFMDWYKIVEINCENLITILGLY